MYTDQNELLTHFHQRLREEAALRNNEAPKTTFTVADIYYELVPFEICRKELGVVRGRHRYVVLHVDVPADVVSRSDLQERVVVAVTIAVIQAPP